MLSRLALVSAVCLAAPSLAATYNRAANVVGTGFNSFFQYQAISDPTHGRVNYVDQATAQRLNLTFASSDTFILRGDSTTTLSASGAGRNSVRIRSNSQFDTHVTIFNVRHMPEGCGTWPAIWETDEASWPSKGEVDIVEGVNNVSPNAATLHTTSGCTMPASRTQTGTNRQLDCNTAVNGNAGCGVAMTESNSFGPGFNNNGGGWFASERTNTYVRVWFWPRNAGNVPASIRTPGASVDTSSWGTPSASFPNTSCDLDAKFGPNNIIINLTFCGDWAGSTFNNDGCAGSCVDYVNNNPTAFRNAYFDIASLNVYT